MADEIDVVATPEGDNEFNPSEPLKPLPKGAMQVPDGSAPAAYREDKAEPERG